MSVGGASRNAGEYANARSVMCASTPRMRTVWRRRIVRAGFDVDLALRTDRSTLYRTYLEHVPLAEAHRTGQIELQGSRAFIRSFIDAFHPSPVASLVAAETPE